MPAARVYSRGHLNTYRIYSLKMVVGSSRDFCIVVVPAYDNERANERTNARPLTVSIISCSGRERADLTQSHPATHVDDGVSEQVTCVLGQYYMHCKSEYEYRDTKHGRVMHADLYESLHAYGFHFSGRAGWDTIEIGSSQHLSTPK